MYIEVFNMVQSTFDSLNKARQQIIDGNDDLMHTIYNRAATQNIPYSFVELHRTTKGYMLLPMAESSPVYYFENLKKAKRDADSSELLRAEYQNALQTLINVKNMVLRDIAVNYFCEVCTCSWGSNYGKSLDDLYLYIEKFIDDITINDCYGITKYRPDCDLRILRRDLKSVQAYALNLLLMYVTHKSTQYEGKTYYANTMDFGSYYYTQVKSYDNYSHNAVARPRLFQLCKQEYYPDYLQAFESLKAELNISPEAELKSEIKRLVDRKHAKSTGEKEYFKYAKRLAKDDPERRSFYNVFGRIYPGYNTLVKPILKACWGVDEVGSFNLDQPFTRKRFLGVCNMLAWANDWSVEMVRTVMFLLGLMGIGILAYFGLFIAMKANFYLTNFAVEKHI
jgi:phage shock protein PspC (stress-responsive transcriptional regulator)